MNKFLHQPGFLGTHANLAADITLLVGLLVATLFTIGMVMAMQGRGASVDELLELRTAVKAAHRGERGVKAGARDGPGMGPRLLQAGGTGILQLAVVVPWGPCPFCCP